MRSAWAPMVVVGSILLAVACGDDDAGGGASSSSSGGASSSSSGSIIGGSTSGATTSSGGSNLSLDTYAAAICAKVEDCQPAAFRTSWATKDDCAKEVRASNEEGLTLLPGSAVSQDQVNACTSKLAAASCAFGLGDVEACVLKGTLDDGAPCFDGRQCKTGRCKRAFGADCGTCAPFESTDGACIEDGDCTFGLSCFEGKCKKRLAKGEACTEGGQICAPGLVCANGNCADPVAKDGACTAEGNECGRGLRCFGGKCQEPNADAKVAILGESCGAGIVCRKSSCRGAAGGEKCVAYTKTGDRCGFETNGPADCDAENNCFEGTCAKNIYPACK